MHIYLQNGKSDKSCKVTATITLRSSLGKKLDLSQTWKRIFKSNSGWGKKFVKWDDLINERNGYLNNDSLEIHVLLEVLPHEVLKCADCQKLCSTCSS